MKLYVLKNGQVLGPFTETEIRSQLAAGTISENDSFAAEGESTWKPLAQSSLMQPPGAALPIVPPPAIPSNPHYSPASQAGATSNLAIGALVSGIIGFFCGITSIVAVILGHLALTELKTHPEMKGREMALVGLVLGYIVLALFALGLIAGVFFGAFASQMQHFSSH